MLKEDANLLIESSKIVEKYLRILLERETPKPAKDQAPSDTFVGRYVGNCPICDQFATIRRDEYEGNNAYCKKCGQLIHFDIKED